MTILLNGAGGSAADPILDGLAMQLIAAPTTMDVATVNAAGLDQATGFPVTNSIAGSLTPATSVVTAGAAGSFTDSSDQYTISSTTGLAAGDYIYLSHASITDGVYEIASVVDGTNLTLTTNPMDGGGDKTSIAYQVCWMYPTTAGTAPMTSDGPGDENFFKFDGEDSGTNATQQEDTFFVRDALSGSSYVALQGVSYTGQTVAVFALTLAILSGWTNQGGITHVEMANHSIQTVNNFTWTTLGGTGEQTLADAETNGITAAAGDGAKYGRLLFKTKAGGTALGLDIDITVDSAGPTIALSIVGG